MTKKKTEKEELEEKFLSRIKSQDRFYRKGSNHDLFPIGLITSSVNQGRKGEDAEMNQFIKDSVISQIVMHYKTGNGECKQCKWKDLRSLQYDSSTCRVNVCLAEEKGFLVEPPINQYTVDFIRNLSPELSSISFPQQEMLLEKPSGKGSSGKKAIYAISLDHIIPINLFLHKEIAAKLFPKLHELNVAIQSLAGFGDVESQKEFDNFMKENMNDEIRTKCREVFEEFKNPDSKSLEYLFAMQLMSRGANSAKNDDTI